MTERAFIIDKQLQRLLLSTDSELSREISHAATDKNDLLLSMQAIVNAIIDPNSTQSKQTLSIVNTSSQYVNWYKLILATFTNMQSAAQVAASSVQEDNLLVNRVGRGFTLQVTQQPLKQADAFIIVSFEQLTKEQQENELFLHCIWEQQLYVISFGVPIENRAQALVSVQDKAFIAIANPESHLYLI